MSTYNKGTVNIKTSSGSKVYGTVGGSGGGSSVDIVTSWEVTPSDEKVPSEKLVKDSIPTVDASLDASSTNAIQNKAVNTALGNKASSTLVNNAIGTSSSYNSELVYAVGDYCIYSNKLWVCTTSGSGQTPSASSTYWKQVSLTSLNSTLTNFGECEILYNKVTTGENITVNLNLYRYIGVSYLAGNLAYNSSIMPVSLFKTFLGLASVNTSGSNTDQAQIRYVNDTTIYVASGNNRNCFVFGIK